MAKLKIKKVHPLQWIFDPLEEHPEFQQKKMFGCEVAYLGDRLMLGLVANNEPWNGLLIATYREYHEALRGLAPSLQPHPILGKWLYLSQSHPDFETIANQLVLLVMKGSPLIGVEPKSRKSSKKQKRVKKKKVTRKNVKSQKAKTILSRGTKAGLIVFVLRLLTQTDAWAAGFEKSILWSGHYAGLGAAAASIVKGPESLFFNPAGLAAAEGSQWVGNFSPAFTQSSAPVIASGTTLDSARTFSPSGSGLFSLKILPTLGLGVGYFVSGGSQTLYSNVDFSGGSESLSHLTLLRPKLQSEFTFTELSTGIGYELIRGFRLGAAYRIVFVSGQIGLVSRSTLPNYGESLIATELSQMRDTGYTGFRIGLQYSPEEAHWGLGAQLRNEISFAARGNSSGSLIPVNPALGNSPVSLSGGAATLANVFPMQLSFGGYLDLVPDIWKLVGEYTFTQYQRNSNLDVSGSLTDPLGQTIPLASVPQNWNNQSQLRFGTEYSLLPAWMLRAGYVLTSQVVPNSSARPIFSAPGVEHTFTLGAGALVLPNLGVNLAVEFTTASGTVFASDQPMSGVNSGSYSDSAFAAHLGVTYSI